MWDWFRNDCQKFGKWKIFFNSRKSISFFQILKFNFKLLAGANVNDLTNNKKTSLHLIAECNHAAAVSICIILLENGIDFNALDSFSNNGNFRFYIFSIELN